MDVNRGLKPAIVALTDTFFFPKVAVCEVVRIALTKGRREEAGFDGDAMWRRE